MLWFSLISAPVYADVIQDVPEAAGYTLVYELDIPNTPPLISLALITCRTTRVMWISPSTASRIMELQEPEGERRFVYVSLPTPVLLAAQTGIPHSGTGVALQQYVQEMRVVSNHPSIQSTGTVNTGVIEFWPSNYATNNVYQIPNASDDLYDFGDQSLGGSGYGSMQIHDYATGQTLLAYNAWGSGGTPSDLGIGNNTATVPTSTRTGPSLRMRAPTSSKNLACSFAPVSHRRDSPSPSSLPRLTRWFSDKRATWEDFKLAGNCIPLVRASRDA